MSPISVDRKFGSYPISIASSLAFEGLLHTGEFADRGGELAIKDYQALYLNLRTLFRNAFYAFEENRERLTPDVLKTCIDEDIENIFATARAVAPSMVCVLYLCEYHSVNRVFPKGDFRNANTPNQVFYNSLEDDVYKMFLREEPRRDYFKIFDVFPKGDKKTLILTHYPADLLAVKDFPILGLLESHTGEVKTQLQWNSKLYNKPKNIPFNKGFLTLFGDNVMFHPQDRKVRNVVLKTAEKYSWHADTTMDRIYNCLKLVNEPHVIDYLRKLNS